jgi:hypothetical protein
VLHYTIELHLIFDTMSSLTAIVGDSSESEMERPPPTYDNFYTPSNREFYSSFQYTTLNPTERHFRLLRIHALGTNDNQNSTITCDLLDDLPLEDMKSRYTTISYCAGDPNRTEMILVNGFYFNAFANLGHALRQARYFWKKHNEHKELYLWADQVCIDQSNEMERSHQVGFMGDIYAAAEQVLVCLSTEGDPSGGIAWLSQFAGSTSCDPESYDPKNLERCWNDEHLHRSWNALIQTVINSAWFSRAWVRQEFVRSSKAHFLAAEESIKWTLLDAYLGTYRWAMRFDQVSGYSHSRQLCKFTETCQICKAGLSEVDLFKGISNAKTLMALKKRSTYVPQDLLHNLKQVAECQSSDPRDLIYAFLGISEPKYGIIPDYAAGISFADICTQLARNVIVQTRNLEILRSACRRNDYKTLEDSNLPSWAPDWRRIAMALPPREGERPQELLPGTYSFESNDAGLHDRILVARGICKSVVQKYGSKKRKIRTNISGLRLAGACAVGDEVWILHGASCPYIFRRRGEYHKLIGQAYNVHTRKAVYRDMLQGAAHLFEENDPSVCTIKIC